VFNDVISTE